MWNVILGAAETPESLELCLNNSWQLGAGEVSLRFDYKAHEHADDISEFDIRPFRLDPLKSLRQLKIISLDHWRNARDFRNELTIMRMILASSGPASPVHICSVILEPSFGRLNPWEDVTTSLILTPDKWLPIDRILTSPKFVDLHIVEVRVNRMKTHCISVGGSQISFDFGGEFVFSALLPVISSHPKISLITSTTCME